MFVSWCRCVEFVPLTHPVAIPRALFCIVCRVSMFLFLIIGDHMVDAYSSIGRVIVL